MKITGIKFKTEYEGQMHDMVDTLERKIKVAGFDVVINILTRSSINITGRHHRHGPRVFKPNYRVNIYSSEKGYKKCYTPTWDQYYKLNRIVNAVLNKFKVTATVRSGEYLIRDRINGAHTDWIQPEWVFKNANNGYGPVFGTEKEAIKHIKNVKKSRQEIEALYRDEYLATKMKPATTLKLINGDK